MGFIVNTNREFAGDQYKNVLNKDTNEVLAFPINMSDDEIDVAIASDKTGRPSADINPSIYETILKPAMDEAKVTGNSQILYDARRRIRQTDPFLSAIDAGPFGLFANNAPNVKVEREANIKANPTAAFFGNLTQQTFEILSLAKIAGPIIEPIASKIGFLARGMTPMAIRAAEVGSGEVLPKVAGEVVRKAVTAGTSASLLGALYNTVKESAVQGKTLFDDTEGKLEQTVPDLVKIGTEAFKGLGWFPYGVGGAFSRDTTLGLTTGVLASGGAFYTISKAEGASESDSLLNLFIGGFLHLASFGDHTPKQREQIIGGIQDALASYVKAKNGMTEKNNIHELIADGFISKTAEEILNEKQITDFENEGGAIAKIAQSPEYTKELVTRIADQVLTPEEQVLQNEGGIQSESPFRSTEKTLSLPQGETIANKRTIPTVTLEKGKLSDYAVLNNKGENVGLVQFSPKTIAEEGLRIDIKNKGNLYGTSAIKQVFDSGVPEIGGDVGKDNIEGQKFWKSIGAELKDTGSGNFRFQLKSEDFYNTINKKYNIEQKGVQNAKGTGTETKIGGTQETPIQETADGVRVRDNAQNGLETKQVKESGIAKSILAKSIENGLIEAKKDYDIAEYTPTTMKEQADLMADIMSNDIERAKRLALGTEELPKGLNGITAWKAIENYAMQTKDGQLALDLARSPIAERLSKAAQEVSLTRGRTPDSATAKIKEINKELEKANEKNLKDKKPETVKKELKEALKEKINKTKPTKKNWETFLDEIAC